MEDPQFIAMYLWKFQTEEEWQHWAKWTVSSLTPLLVSSGYVIGIDGFRILDERYKYCTLAFNYLKSVEDYFYYMQSPERLAHNKDINITWKGKYEWAWVTNYLLIRRFKNPSAVQIPEGEFINKTTRVKDFTEEDGPVMLMRGLGLSPDGWEKYESWMIDWGYGVYVPLLVKVPGVMEYSRYWLSNIGLVGMPPKPGTTENPEHAQDLTLIYFENMKACDNFLNSRELAAYDQNLANAFPDGLHYIWNYTCKLTRRYSP